MKPSDVDANESVAQGSSGPLPLKYLQRYGLAFLSVGVALGASLLLEHFHFRDAAFPLLLFAVAIGSWYGGSGPAVLAVILSTVGFYWFFVEPVRTIYINWSEVPYFMIFAAFAVLISWFSRLRRRVEATLRQSHEVLREQASLLDLTHDAVYVRDMRGVISYWNRGAEVLYGWPSERALGKVAREFLKAVFPLPLEKIEAELVRTGRWEGELAKTHKDGAQLVVASRWSLKRDDQGDPVAILVTSNDITESKRAEEALLRLNRELRALSNCNQALLRATDEQSLLQEICRIVCEEAGYRMAWVGHAEHDGAKSVRPVAWTGAEDGYFATARVTWADTERGRGPTGTAIRSGKSCCIQDYAKDPRAAPWREGALQRGFRSGIALPLKDERANVFGSLTVHSAHPNAFTPEEIRLLEELAGDLAFGIVTLRSRAARQQAEQEVTRLSFALDNVREAAFLIDDTGRFRYVNGEGCRSLGYTRAELLGMGVADVDPERPAERWPDHWRDLKAQRSLSFESRLRTRAGRMFPVEVSANYFEYGGRAYNLALVRDITERKQAQEALERERELFVSGSNVAYRVCAAPGWPLEYVSPNMKDQFGYVPETLVRGEVPAARLIHPDDLPRVAKEVEAHSNAGDSYFSLEFRAVHANGEHLWVYNFVVVRRDANGLITHYHGYLSNINDRKRAEEALRLSGVYNRSLIEASLDPLVTIGPDGKITDVNGATEAATGRSRGELIGTDFCDYFTEPAQARAGYERVFREGAVRDYPLELRHRSGRVMPVLYNASVYRDGSGRVIGVFAAARDITGRKRAEEQALRLAAIVESSEDAILSKTLEGVILSWNWGAQKVYGYTAQEIVGKPISILSDPGSPDETPQILSRVGQGESLDHYETVRRRKDGSLITVSLTLSPIRDASGRIVGASTIARDITERKQAEDRLRRTAEALRRSEAYLASAQKLTQTGAYAMNGTSREPIYWSEGMFRLFGTDPKEGLLKRDQVWQRIHPEDRDKVKAASDRAFLKKVDSEVEYRIVLPDGAVKLVHTQAHPVLSANGEVAEVVAAIVDITERKRAEEALRSSEMERWRAETALQEARAELERVSRATTLGALTASIAHEVNQPLAGVVTSANAGLNWLAANPPNLSKTREALERVRRDGTRAGEVIARIRGLLKRTPSAKVLVSVNKIVNEVLALTAGKLRGDNIETVLALDPSLFAIRGDAIRLQQVLLNLTTNAIEAMAEVTNGPRTLRIQSGRGELEGKPAVVVAVSDTGTGFGSTDIARLFEAFHTTKPQGMGMGLWISRSIIEEHGGRLTAQCNSGPGATFVLTIPSEQEAAV